MKGHTRFSRDDLKALKAETEVVRESIANLSQHLLNANLARTGSHFYDSDVRSVSDSLFTKLNALERLLYVESCRHDSVAEEMTV